MRLPGISDLPIPRPVARRLALGLAGLRSLLGVGALLAPSLAGKPWIGEDASRPGTRLFGRSMGGRDLALGLGALLAARHATPIRGWVEAGALADLSDVAATALSFRKLPERSRLLILAASAGAVLAGLALSPLVDEPLD